MKIHVVKPLCSVSKLSAESVGSHRELAANCIHTHVGVGGVYLALHCSYAAYVVCITTAAIIFLEMMLAGS